MVQKLGGKTLTFHNMCVVSSSPQLVGILGKRFEVVTGENKASIANF